jgi:hypothetical protein
MVQWTLVRTRQSLQMARQTSYRVSYWCLNSLKYEMEPLQVKDVGGWKYAEGTGWMVVEDIYVHSGKAI